MARCAPSTSHSAGLYGSVCRQAGLHVVTITPNYEAQSREFAVSARYRQHSSPCAHNEQSNDKSPQGAGRR